MERQYDVFISFKNSNADGSQSVDATVASQLYKELSMRNVNAFYSNVKLLELGEAKYKSAIETALDQCKILICIISCEQFVDSNWIKYERESFHEDILSGRNPNGVIIPFLGEELSGNVVPRSLRNYEFFRIGYHSVKDVCDFVNVILSKTPKQEEVKTSLITGKIVSAYSPEYGKEFKRLRIQAENTRDADMPAIEYCLQRLNKDKLYVLDVGCAYGYVTKNRFENIANATVLGVDRSEKCLQYAKEHNANDNVFYEQLDLESEDMEDELENLMDKHDVPKFDIIFSSLVIHHLKNPNKTLRKLRKFLTDTGFIIIRGSDDGSIMTYNDDGLIEKVVNLHLSTEGISDRANGRKIYHQLVTSGYKNVVMKNYVKDLSGLDLDGRNDFFLERYDYRKNYLKMVWDKDPYNLEKKNNYEYMKVLLEELENKFADKSFWCCEVDFVGIAQKD